MGLFSVPKSERDRRIVDVLLAEAETKDRTRLAGPRAAARGELDTGLPKLEAAALKAAGERDKVEAELQAAIMKLSEIGVRRTATYQAAVNTGLEAGRFRLERERFLVETAPPEIDVLIGELVARRARMFAAATLRGGEARETDREEVDPRHYQSSWLRAHEFFSREPSAYRLADALSELVIEAEALKLQVLSEQALAVELEKIRVAAVALGEPKLERVA